MATNDKSRIRLPERLHDDMVAHAVRDAPLECVGVIGFDPSQRGVEGVLGTGALRIEAHNRAMEPRHNFWVEPYEQFQIEELLAERGFTVDLIYHSHPGTPAFPSGSDRLLAGGRLMLIISLLVDPPDVRCWKISNPEEEPDEIEVELVSFT